MCKMLNVGIYRKNKFVKFPKKLTDGSACYDIQAYLEDYQEVIYYNKINNKCKKIIHNGLIVIHSGERVLIPTGLTFDIPKGYSLRVHPRSGLSLKSGLTLVNCEGVIDSDYVDPTYILLYNISECAVELKNGDRICQIELIPVLNYEFEEIENKIKQKTNRNGGFGSTGK